MILRVYEEMFILKPDTAEEAVDAVIEQIKKTITDDSGTVDKAERWGGGRRQLAYKIEKYSEGIYILIQFTAKPSTVKEVERRLRVNDLVIKFITVRIDERLKLAAKRKKREEKRAARKPVIPLGTPGALPGSPGPGSPGPVLPPVPAAPVPGAPVAPAPAAE
jgi:small subunit ribosomal protein S6